jgi:hypothetical protein
LQRLIGAAGFCYSAGSMGYFPGSMTMMSARSFLFLALVALVSQGCASVHPRSNHSMPPGTALNLGSSTDTGLLEPNIGYRGDRLGAEVVNAEISGELQSIEINVPIEPDAVDRIQVMTQSGELLPLSRQATIVRNYETNNVGITIQLPKSENLRFRLKLIDDPRND